MISDTRDFLIYMLTICMSSFKNFYLGPWLNFYYFIFFLMLVIEHSNSWMLGKCSTTELYPCPSPAYSSNVIKNF